MWDYFYECMSNIHILSAKMKLELLLIFARIVTRNISEIDTGYVVTRKGFKKRVDKLDLSFMNFQDAFKSKSTMEVRKQ